LKIHSQFSITTQPRPQIHLYTPQAQLQTEQFAKPKPQTTKNDQEIDPTMKSKQIVGVTIPVKKPNIEPINTNLYNQTESDQIYLKKEHTIKIPVQSY